MPQHGQAAKWSNLAAELVWDSDVLTLQRFALVVMRLVPNPKIRHSFLEFYFGDKDNGHTSSYYNNLDTAREIMEAAYNLCKQAGVNPLEEFEGTNLNDLKDMVRYGR